MNKLIALAVAIVLIALAPAANATVVWTFYETGCTNSTGQCHSDHPVAFPFPLMTLTLPGPTSAGTAVWQPGMGPPPPVYTGDTFALSYGGVLSLTPAFTGSNVVGQCSPATGHGICNFDLSWGETAGQLNSVSVQLLGITDQIGRVSGGGGFGLTGGIIASDGEVDNCQLTSCIVTGFWQSDIPEPMSASLLLIGLLGLAFTRRYLRLSRGGGKIG